MATFDLVTSGRGPEFGLKDRVTYGQLIKALQDKQDEQFNTMIDNGDLYGYIDSTLDESSQVRRIYDDYMNRVHKAAANRDTDELVNLRHQYAGIIGRIANAEKQRQAEVVDQRKLLMSDPTYVFSRYATNNTVDDYFNGIPDTYKGFSGKQLMNDVYKEASNLKSVMQEYISNPETSSNIEERYGYTPEQITEAINNPSSDNSGVLQSIVDKAVASTGVNQWGDSQAVQKAYDYARQGLWSAVGTKKITAPKVSTGSSDNSTGGATSKEIEEQQEEMGAVANSSEFGESYNDTNKEDEDAANQLDGAF